MPSLPQGDSEIELVEPTSDDSGIARFLEKRGPGMHHVCFEVQDIHISLSHLNEIGVRLINETPRKSSDGKLRFYPPGKH